MASRRQNDSAIDVGKDYDANSKRRRHCCTGSSWFVSACVIVCGSAFLFLVWLGIVGLSLQSHKTSIKEPVEKRTHQPKHIYIVGLEASGSRYIAATVYEALAGENLRAEEIWDGITPSCKIAHDHHSNVDYHVNRISLPFDGPCQDTQAQKLQVLHTPLPDLCALPARGAMKKGIIHDQSRSVNHHDQLPVVPSSKSSAAKFEWVGPVNKNKQDKKSKSVVFPSAAIPNINRPPPPPRSDGLRHLLKKDTASAAESAPPRRHGNRRFFNLTLQLSSTENSLAVLVVRDFALSLVSKLQPECNLESAFEEHKLGKRIMREALTTFGSERVFVISYEALEYFPQTIFSDLWNFLDVNTDIDPKFHNDNAHMLQIPLELEIQRDSNLQPHDINNLQDVWSYFDRAKQRVADADTPSKEPDMGLDIELIDTEPITTTTKKPVNSGWVDLNHFGTPKDKHKKT